MQRTLFLVIVTDYQSGVNSWSCQKRLSSIVWLLMYNQVYLGFDNLVPRYSFRGFKRNPRFVFPKLCKDMYEIHMAQ